METNRIKICKILFFVLVILLLVYVISLLCSKGKGNDKSKDKYEKYNTTIQANNIDDLSRVYIDNGELNTNKLFSKSSMNHNIQQENLRLLSSMLDSHEIPYYIDCGTLLGCIREKSFIQGDTDADITMSKQGINELRLVLGDLEKMGFISFRNSNSWMSMSLLRKGEYIDIYSHHDTIPFDLIRVPFLGNTYPIPKYYDDYLTELYGSWRTPDPNGKGDGSWEKGMPKYIEKWGKTITSPLPLVIITGACKNYADKLSRFIGSVHHYEPDTYIYVCDFGLTEEQVGNIKKYKNVIYKPLDLSTYPKFLHNKENRGIKQSLKIIALHELVNEISNDIIWLDAGNQIGGNLDMVRTNIKKKEFITSCVENDYHMRDYTHIGMINYLNLPNYKNTSLGHISSGFFGIRGGTNTNVYKKIIKPALQCVLNKNCIEPNGASLENHRYDASILTLLLKKNNMLVYCGENSYCPSYDNCMGITLCNNNCPQNMPTHSNYTIQFQRGSGPNFTPRSV